MSAGGEAPLEHLNRSIQPSRDIRAGDVEVFCRLSRGKTLVQTQLDHLTVGVREKQNYLLQQAKKLCFLDESFGSSAWIFHFEDGNFAAPNALAANILGGAGDDRAHPGASLWTIEVGMVDSLQCEVLPKNWTGR